MNRDPSSRSASLRRTQSSTGFAGRSHRIIDLAVEIRHETALAYLVHDGGREAWLPKSLVEVSEERGQHIVTLPEWLAKREGLI